jgi:hypothetical protein
MQQWFLTYVFENMNPHKQLNLIFAKLLIAMNGDVYSQVGRNLKILTNFNFAGALAFTPCSSKRHQSDNFPIEH